MHRCFIICFMYFSSACLGFGGSFVCAGSAGHVWSDGSGTSWLYGFHAAGSFSAAAADFSVSLSAHGIRSTLAAVSGNAGTITAAAECNGEYAGICFSVGTIGAGNIAFQTEYTYSVHQISGLYGTVSLPVYFVGKKQKDRFFAAPFFSVATMKSGSGDWYFFTGVPAVPFFRAAGVTGSFYGYKTKVVFAKLDCVIENEEENIIRSDPYLAGAFLQRSWKIPHWCFTPGAGCMYIYGCFDGALTAENQLYMMFPYKIFNVSGSVDALLILAGINCTFQSDWLSCTLNGNLLFLPRQTGVYTASWQYKNTVFFDGTDGGEKGTLNVFDMNGIAFFTVAVQANMAKKQLPLTVNLSKTFFIPFSLNSMAAKSSGHEDSGRGEPIKNDTFFSWLLSGLTFCITYTP